jgi:hypothetical protein
MKLAMRKNYFTSVSTQNWVLLSSVFRIKPLQARAGQSALIAVAVTMLLALILMGLSVVTLNSSNINRMTAQDQSLQSYYVSQAGIQEAIASRIGPRSNFLNFRPANLRPLPPQYALSGKVYENPANLTKMIGMYRYIILGGDPARDRNTSAYYSNIDLLFQDQNVSKQPIYVVSKGAICETAAGKAIYDGLEISAATNKPQCKSTAVAAGGTLKETTLTATFDFSRTVSNTDIVSDYKVVPPNSPVTLTTPVVLLGGAIGNQFQFEDAWQNMSPGAKPLMIVFHKLSQPYNTVAVPITSTTTTVPTAVLKEHQIKIFLQNNMDPRSLYQNDRALCQSNSQKCAVRIERLEGQNGTPSGTFYNNARLEPNWTFLNQIILFPPKDSKKNGMGNGQRYRLTIDKNLRDSKGTALGQDYTIDFTITN